ncbi:MAG TPA: hypothetical protein PLU10_10480 [Chitinophagaceae bacterium]|nr:hypothetical protein [Chitinophagaceae bacterium]
MNTKFLILSLICITGYTSVWAQNAVSSRDKQRVKDIIAKLYVNYAEIKTEDAPIEIKTQTTIIQRKNSEKIEYDTTQSEMTNYVQAGYTMMNDPDGAQIVMSKDAFITIDSDEKTIFLQDPKTEEALHAETAALRKRTHDLIDSLADSDWSMDGNLVIIEKNYALTQNASDAVINHIKFVFDIKEEKIKSQEVDYENYDVEKVICNYFYTSHPAKKKKTTIDDLTKDSKYTDFIVSDKRTKK